MKHVYFIDDEASIRRGLKRMAEKIWMPSFPDGSVELMVADSTEQLLVAVDKMGEGNRLLLITDGNMRGEEGFLLDGHELIEIVREKLGSRLAHAIMMTGNSSSERFQEASVRLGFELVDKSVLLKLESRIFDFVAS